MTSPILVKRETWQLVFRPNCHGTCPRKLVNCSLDWSFRSREAPDRARGSRTRARGVVRVDPQEPQVNSRRTMFAETDAWGAAICHASPILLFLAPEEQFWFTSWPGLPTSSRSGLKGGSGLKLCSWNRILRRSFLEYSIKIFSIYCFLVVSSSVSHGHKDTHVSSVKP